MTSGMTKSQQKDAVPRLQVNFKCRISGNGMITSEVPLPVKLKHVNFHIKCNLSRLVAYKEFFKIF